MYWRREKGAYVGLEIRDRENAALVFRGSINGCGGCGRGRKTCNKVLVEDHDVLKQELTGHTKFQNVQTKRPWTLATVQRVLRSTFTWGENKYDKRRILVVGTGAQLVSNSTSSLEQSQSSCAVVSVSSAEDNRGELEMLLVKLQTACQWNEEALRQLDTLRSYLAVALLICNWLNYTTKAKVKTSGSGMVSQL